MDPIKAKIQELVPSVKGICTSHDYHHNNCLGCDMNERTVTLAVAVQAYLNGTENKTSDEFRNEITTLVALWMDGKEDNYDTKHEKCKLFIGKLLGV